MVENAHKGIKVEGCGKANATWYLYSDLCKGCGLCLVKCPVNAKGGKCLEWSKEVGLYMTPAVEPDPATCIGCGICENVCPDTAIRIEKNQ